MSNENQKTNSQISSTYEAGGSQLSPNAETSTQSMADKALEAAKILKAENDRHLAIMEAEKELMARRALGGQSIVSEAPKIETPQEYAKRILSNKK